MHTRALELGWLRNVATGNIHVTSSLRQEISLKFREIPRKSSVFFRDMSQNFAVRKNVDHPT
jgi:hypothetical protein